MYTGLRKLKTINDLHKCVLHGTSEKTALSSRVGAGQWHVRACMIFLQCGEYLKNKVKIRASDNLDETYYRSDNKGFR